MKSEIRKSEINIEFCLETSIKSSISITIVREKNISGKESKTDALSMIKSLVKETKLI